MIEYFKSQIEDSNELMYLIHDYTRNPGLIHIELMNMKTDELDKFDFSNYKFIRMFHENIPTFEIKNIETEK